MPNPITELLNWAQYEHRRRNPVKVIIITAVAERMRRRKELYHGITEKGMGRIARGGMMRL